MKKILLIILCCVLCSNCFARERDINCEIENRNSVTFFTKHKSGSLLKSFVKFVDENNNEQYWFRIENNSSNRFLYYMDIVLDNQTYRLYEIQNPNFHHIKSTTAYPDPHAMITYTFYEIPTDVIEKIKISQSPIEFIVNRQKRQGIRFTSDMGFTQAAQQIIFLKYNDKTKYWQSNIQS